MLSAIFSKHTFRVHRSRRLRKISQRKTSHTQSGPVYGIRRGFHGYWRMRSTPAMKNSRRSSTKTSTKKPSRSKAHGAGIRRLRKARASGRSATVSAADNAARQCSGTSIPTVQSGKAGHAATQTAAFGCGSATESCSRKSRSFHPEKALTTGPLCILGRLSLKCWDNLRRVFYTFQRHFKRNVKCFFVFIMFPQFHTRRRR